MMEAELRAIAQASPSVHPFRTGVELRFERMLETGEGSAVTVSVEADGIRLSTSDVLDTGDLLSLELPIDATEDPRVRLVFARVLWCEQDIDSGRTLARLRLLDMGPDVREQLYDFMVMAASRESRPWAPGPTEPSPDRLGLQGLVIDDDDAVRRLLELQLRQTEGLEVRSAGTLTEARALAQVHPPDIVFLDINLPDGNGLDLLSELKSRQGCDPFVIVMTSEATADNAIGALRGRAFDFLPKPFARLDAAQTMARRAIEVLELRRDRERLVSELAATNRELYGMATVDSLTGLYMRRFFEDRLNRELTRAARSDSACSLVVVDLDRLKMINDSWGHAAGDAALRHVARIMREQTRLLDVPARLGGDEFALLLPGADADVARMVAERIRKKIAGVPLMSGDVSLTVTVSMGVASYPEHEARSPSELMELADRALYQSKQQGERNSVTVSRDTG